MFIQRKKLVRFCCLISVFSAVLPLCAENASIRETINRANVGRQEIEARGEEKVKEANEVFIQAARSRDVRKEYQRAANLYLEAIKIFKKFETSVFASKMAYCRSQIGKCYYSMAQKAMLDAEEKATVQDFEEAIRICKEAIEYYPEGAARLTDKIEEFELRRQSAVNKNLVTEQGLLPDKQSQDYQVEVLLQQGRELCAKEQYSKAYRKYQEVLLINPYNQDAIQSIASISTRIGKVAEERYKLTHRKFMTELSWKYSLPALADVNAVTDNMISAPKKKETEDSPLMKKLKSIRIPKLDFDEISISSAVDNLAKQSRREDPEQLGVNIFLRRGGAAAETKEGDQKNAAPKAAPVPAKKANAGNEDGGDNNAEDETSAEQEERQITLMITNKSLLEAIQLLCKFGKLKYRVEKYAVVLAPENIALDDLETKIFPIDQAALAEVEGGGDEKSGLQKFFEDKGVTFPDGSQIVYDKRISRLIVTNTMENINQIELIIQEVLTKPEPMVQIQAKFIEISQNDLQELAFNYQYQVNYDANTAESQKAGGTAQTIIGPSSSSLLRHYTDTEDTTTDNQTLTFTWKNDAGTEFSMEMFAMDRADSTDVLGAPRVTTLPGKLAHVEMVTERYFPDEWETVDLPVTSGSSGSETNETTSSWRGERADPQPTFEDEPTKLGIVFDITPEVDVDRRTITAQIRLPVVSFSGWLIADSRTDVTDDDGEYEKMAIFDKREINTKITAYDGETIILGGVAQDKIDMGVDKIPILGDLPIIGRLFQSRWTRSMKTNLLIFMTCRLVKPDGTAFYPSEQRSRGIPEFRYY